MGRDGGGGGVKGCEEGEPRERGVKRASGRVRQGKRDRGRRGRRPGETDGRVRMGRKEALEKRGGSAEGRGRGGLRELYD